MLATLFALSPYSTWSAVDVAVALIVLAAIIGIVLIFARQAGVTIPGWLVQVLWICVAAVVCIAAIRFVSSL